MPNYSRLTFTSISAKISRPECNFKNGTTEMSTEQPTQKKTVIEKCKPGVHKRTLLFTAGAMWLAVGIWLDLLAYSWLTTPPLRPAIYSFVTGLALALLISRFGLLRIANKNIKRIDVIEHKTCLFSFIRWKGYVIIIVMIAIGVLLRHSEIPKFYLAALYIGIGTALTLSSVRYFHHFILDFKTR